MPRYRLLIEYDGTAFVGWQRQDNGASVQGALERAVKLFCDEAAEVTGAGRTDAGVHATGQVAHLDLDRAVAPDKLRDAVNFHLRPAPVVVIEAAEVATDFHARFTALRRHYRYRILNRRSPPVLERGRVWWVPKPLDAAAMHDAAQLLVGQHDFSSFRAAQCQAKSPVKTLDALAVRREGEMIVIETTARSFLHNQVRAMTGSLKLVGEGRWTAADLAAARDALDRQAAGPNAPPEGLYLTRVDYP